MSAGTGALALTVTVGDRWTPLHVTALASEKVGDVKGRALAAVQVDAAQSDRYEVKFGGALVRDEAATLAACRIGDGAALVVLFKRRRPVR